MKLKHSSYRVKVELPLPAKCTFDVKDGRVVEEDGTQSFEY